jgi:hypothetical protein
MTVDVKRDDTDTEMWLWDLVVGRSFTMLGGGARCDVFLQGGSVNVSAPGTSLVEFDGIVKGKAIRFRGGPGDDEFTIDADRVQRKRLTLDRGPGMDELYDDGWVPPPGSTITGLP